MQHISSKPNTYINLYTVTLQILITSNGPTINCTVQENNYKIHLNTKQTKFYETHTQIDMCAFTTGSNTDKQSGY